MEGRDRKRESETGGNLNLEETRQEDGQTVEEVVEE